MRPLIEWAKTKSKKWQIKGEPMKRKKPVYIMPHVSPAARIKMHEPPDIILPAIVSLFEYQTGNKRNYYAWLEDTPKMIKGRYIAMRYYPAS